MLGVIKVTSNNIDFLDSNVINVRFQGDYRSVFVDNKLMAIKENSSIFAIQVYETNKFEKLLYVLIGLVQKVRSYQVFTDTDISLDLQMTIISENPHQSDYKLELLFTKRFKYKSLIAIRIETVMDTTELYPLLKTKYRTIIGEDGKVYYFTCAFDVSYRYNLAGQKIPETGYIKGGALAFYSEKEIASQTEVEELNYILHNMTGSLI